MLTAYLKVSFPLVGRDNVSKLQRAPGVIIRFRAVIMVK